MHRHTHPHLHVHVHMQTQIQIHIHAGGPATVLVKTKFFNRVFAAAKQSFLEAKFCQILAQEFGKIRVLCRFRPVSLEHVNTVFLSFFSEQALQS